MPRLAGTQGWRVRGLDSAAEPHFGSSVVCGVSDALRTSRMARGGVPKGRPISHLERQLCEAGRPRCSYSHINSLYDKPAHVRSAQSHTVSAQAVRGRRARSLASLAKGRQARQIADRATAARAAKKRRASGRSGAQNNRAAREQAWPKPWTSSSRAAASSNWK